MLDSPMSSPVVATTLRPYQSPPLSLWRRTWEVRPLCLVQQKFWARSSLQELRYFRFSC